MTHPLLSAHLKSNRIAHTYLFTGMESPRKTEWVMSFSKALNCEKNLGTIFSNVGTGLKSAPTGEICDCQACRKIEKRTYPDVHWLGEDKKSRSIKIEEVRMLLHEASLKPFEGRWKVFILQEAERLTLEAANALLKTLEEPPEHSVFILLVENKAHLLATIQSRAIEIRVPPLPSKDPKENPALQLLEEKGWDGFFTALRDLAREELVETLQDLMAYLKNRCVSHWNHSEKYLKAIDPVYETIEALDANVNQKLALTHLEIQLR